MGFLSSLTTLDVKAPNRSLFDVSRRELDNLTYDYITPKIYTVINKVVCGDKVIWERDSLAPVWVAIKYYSGAICFVHVCNRYKYSHFLINDRGDIEPLDDASYYKKSNEISSTVPVKDYISIELTIKKTTNSFQVYKCLPFDTVVYSEPKIGYICKKVTCEGVTIWEAKEDTERCIQTELYTGSDPFICYLLVCIGDDRRYLHYIRKNDGWALVDEETYDAIRKKSKTESEPPVRHPLQEKIMEMIAGISCAKLKPR